MANKLKYYSDLANEQSEQLTNNQETWINFLEAIGRLYKYSFANQVLIYANDQMLKLVHQWKYGINQ